MSEWEFAQADEAQQLAKVHHFSMMKQQEGGEVEFIIAVKEFLTPKDRALSFFAQADKQINQGVAPYTPVGWGPTLLTALAQCMLEVERFPYKG